MQVIITIIFLLLTNTFAYAELRLPVSCENVTKITIFQNILEEKDAETEGQPYLYTITLDLEPEVAKEYSRIADPNIVATIKPDGTRVSHKPLYLLTPKGIIAGDTSYFECVNSRQILLSFKTKEKAFEAARKVCLKIKPKTIYGYDYLQQQLKSRKSNRSR
ncbi:hypothetical protein [Halodesulfovibrio aestuarii]|uniref:Uncharacterized protein n=1 Tax=Halodesulfovibrio aestuarii TaxID=126333 RepID=A0ABV4JWB1_9BACT